MGASGSTNRIQSNDLEDRVYLLHNTYGSILRLVRRHVMTCVVAETVLLSCARMKLSGVGLYSSLLSTIATGSYLNLI